jgi:hypothetical protein
MSLKHPKETEFEVKASETAIEVLFKPTSSHYTFSRFVDRKDILEFGPLSPDPHIAHARRSGNTGNYLAPEVLAMAFRLASEAVRRK